MTSELSNGKVEGATPTAAPVDAASVHDQPNNTEPPAGDDDAGAGEAAVQSPPLLGLEFMPELVSDSDKQSLSDSSDEASEAEDAEESGPADVTGQNAGQEGPKEPSAKPGAEASKADPTGVANGPELPQSQKAASPSKQDAQATLQSAADQADSASSIIRSAQVGEEQVAVHTAPGSAASNEPPKVQRQAVNPRFGAGSRAANASAATKKATAQEINRKKAEEAREQERRRAEKAREAELEQERVRQWHAEEEEKKRRLQQQAGLGLAETPTKRSNVGRCALRAIPSLAKQCETHDTNYDIAGREKHIKVTCSEACTLYYHFPACYRAFEKLFKSEHPSFNLKGSAEHPCPTDGCCGYITLAQVVPHDPKHEDFRFRKPRAPAPAPKADAGAERGRRAQPGKAREGAGEKRAAAKAPVAPQREQSPEPAVQAGAQVEEPQEGTKTPPLAPPPIVLDDMDFNALRKVRHSEGDDDRWAAVGEAPKAKKHRQRKAKPKNLVELKNFIEPAALPEEVSNADELLFQQPGQRAIPTREPNDRLNYGHSPPRGHLQAVDSASEDGHSAGDNHELSASDFPTLSAQSLAQQEALCILHTFRGGASCFLLVEDIPVQALDNSDPEPDVLAEDHVGIMLRNFGDLDEFCLFRSISSAVARYSQEASAARAFQAIEQMVMVQHEAALTVHYLRAYPDRGLRERLLRDLGEASSAPPLPKLTSQPVGKDLAVAEVAGSAGPSVQAMSAGAGVSRNGVGAQTQGKPDAGPAEGAVQLIFGTAGAIAPSPFSSPVAQAGPSIRPPFPKADAGKAPALKTTFNIQAKEFRPSSSMQATPAPSLGSQSSTGAGGLGPESSKEVSQDSRGKAAEGPVDAGDMLLGTQAKSDASSSVTPELKKDRDKKGSLIMSLFPPRAGLSGSLPNGSEAPPAAKPAQMLEGGISVRIARTFATVPNPFSQTEVLGCNANSLSTYNTMPEFGMAVNAMVDGARASNMPTALVLFDVEGQQLHGLWEAVSGLRTGPGGQQMVVFKRNRKCVPLPNSTCAALLAPGTKYDFQLPQSLDKSATDRLLNAFNARAKEVGQAVEEDAPALVSPSPSTPAPEAAEAGAEAEVFAGMSAGELHEAYKAQQAQEQLFEQAKHDAEFAAKLQEAETATMSASKGLQAAPPRAPSPTPPVPSLPARAASPPPPVPSLPQPPPARLQPHPEAATPATPALQTPASGAASPVPLTTSQAPPRPVQPVSAAPAAAAPAAPASLSAMFPGLFPKESPTPAAPPPQPTPAPPQPAVVQPAAARRPAPYNPMGGAPAPYNPMGATQRPAPPARPASAQAAAERILQAASWPRKCFVCETNRADFLNIGCTHWGPCLQCLPCPKEQIKDAFPTCRHCGAVVDVWQEVHIV